MRNTHIPTPAFFGRGFKIGSLDVCADSRTINVVVVEHDGGYLAFGVQINLGTRGETPELAAQNFTTVLNERHASARGRGLDLFTAIPRSHQWWGEARESGEEQLPNYEIFANPTCTRA